ncbi:MAG: HD domain-containing protein [Victivallales bacterium]|nr:HD domain-containing protein [Victivallales bacterium]
MSMEEITAQIASERDELEQRTLDPKNAYFSKDAQRRRPAEVDDFENLRTPFAHDTDRIIHSSSFARYSDKTQVFFRVRNDHITRRSLHVQMVSRIARTIGRCLNLNEDLIEAIAIGHDIGHTPFGHTGEAALAANLQKAEIGTFVHNAQSVRELQQLEHHGAGLNLTLPVLDGILGHNGEIESRRYEYDRSKLTWENLDKNLEHCLNEPGYDRKVSPSTMEGCVVRVADIISYLGRDFEDAVSLGIIAKTDMPWSIERVLGNENRKIISVLCNDIILNSRGKEYLEFSEEVYGAYSALKKFNYEHIYNCALLSHQKEQFDCMLTQLFDAYITDIRKDIKCKIIDEWIRSQPAEYRLNESPERITADYIACMTDQYFINQYEHRFVPQIINFD